MALPALDLLADRGFALTLAGRPWAKDLFAAYPWTVVSLPGSRVQALRDIRLNTGLLLTNSFSSALEFRLAGISATGYARDGRSWLLRKAIPVNRSRPYGRVLLPACHGALRRVAGDSERSAVAHRRARSTASE